MEAAAARREAQEDAADCAKMKELLEVARREKRAARRPKLPPHHIPLAASELIL